MNGNVSFVSIIYYLNNKNKKVFRSLGKAIFSVQLWKANVARDWSKSQNANYKAENIGASVTRASANDHPPAATLTGRNGEWRDRWCMTRLTLSRHRIGMPFCMIYLTRRWAHARSSENLVGDDGRAEPSTRGAAENIPDAIFRAHDEYSYARALPTETELRNKYPPAQTSRRGGRTTATRRRRPTTATRVRAISASGERGTVASYCAARGADGYTPTRVP